MGGFCSAFDALSREAQESHVAALLEKVHALRPPAAVPPPPAAPLPLHSTLADAQGRLNAPSLGRDSVESGATSSRTSCSEDSPRAPTTRDESEALAALAALCPSASPAANAFLLDVLRSRCGGRVQAAADWLLSCVESGEYDAEQRSWAAAAARRREERAAAAAAAGQARRQIVARYQLQAVPNQWGKEGKAAAWGAVEKDAAAGKGAAAVRFRDGAIVSTKGEKVSGRRERSAQQLDFFGWRATLGACAQLARAHDPRSALLLRRSLWWRSRQSGTAGAAARSSPRASGAWAGSEACAARVELTVAVQKQRKKKSTSVTGPKRGGAAL